MRVDERKPVVEMVLILGIAVVAIHEPTIGIVLDVEQIQVAVGVLYKESHPVHHPLNNLWIEFYTR